MPPAIPTFVLMKQADVVSNAQSDAIVKKEYFFKGKYIKKEIFLYKIITF